MPFARPDLSTLIERAAGDIESRLPGTDARLRRSNLGVLARVHAGAVHGLYGYIDWIARQAIYDTAEAEWLERWASIWGINRKPAAAATGNATFTGTDGAVIPPGTLLTRSDGAELQTTAETTIAAGTAPVPVTAVEAGAAGNTLAGSALTMVTPIAGVQSQAQVAAGGLTGGADIEVDTALRARLLARIRQPPHGGALHDYVAWSLEIPGITRVWPVAGELGVGTVTVRFVRDDDADPIPDAAEVATLQAHLDAERPVTAQVFAVAPIPVPLDLQIRLTPNSATVQAAVTAELQDLLRREAEPGATLLLSHIREAISIATGESDHELLAPVANVEHAVGEMPVLGTITWF
jgi:uncharacterized phage protein gp47/JayE